MDALGDTLATADAQALIAHGIFLREKFGPTAAELTLPVTSGAAP
ncbi:hypothetical protein [Flexivirga caeni]|nr:hypothetical protein [Flexivirga caeni]